MGNYQIFISYNHSDDTYRKELEKWLVTLHDKGLINHWSDSQIMSGDHFWEKIEKKLEEADIIVLLITQEYLASTSCKKEMQYALSVCKTKRVIPIILKPCTWLDTETKDLLALPYDGKPVIKWESREEAWSSVYEGVKKVVNEMNNNFELKADFVKELQKIEFITQAKEKTTLDDIFIFPSLSKFKSPFEKEPVSLDYFIEMKDKAVLIKGREASGKTALARMLFIRLRAGLQPILLDGNSIHKTINFDDYIKKEFNRQMTGDFGNWMQFGNKVAIVDNYHHKISPNFIEYLNDNFAMIIMTMDDEEYMLYFKDDLTISTFSVVSIGQFTLAKQEQLIRNWVQLNLPSQTDVVDDLDVDKLEARVNTIVTTNRIVPRYPFFILSILQTFEAFMPSNLQITAYGHCYHALVVAQLAKKNIPANDIDTCFNYLKNLSYSMYEKTKDGAIYDEQCYFKFRENYKSKFIIKDSLVNKIENDEYPIISLQPEEVMFEYEYIYYFFLGMHLAGSENQEVVNYLCENIHLRENAFALIFTIHHTQNKNLLDTIRLHCVYSFENQKPAELSTEETHFMSNLIAELPESIISAKNVQENRQKERKYKEKYLEEQNDQEKTALTTKEDVSIIELQKGIKILDVLGQILKNRAGSFEKQEVIEILQESIDLGLRILNLFLNGCKEQSFKDWLTKSLQKAEYQLEQTKHKSFDDEKRRAFVEKSIQFFGYTVTIGMINRISESISSDKLVSSLEILADKKNTPAYEMINFLVALSQDGLDAYQVKSLIEKYNKSKNYWAEKTLSHYVQNYLNTHQVNFRDRQRLAQILNVKLLLNKVG